jgi:hypothetical protein
MKGETMKRLIRLFALACATLAAGPSEPNGTAHAQCAGGCCGGCSAGPAFVPAVPPAWEWRCYPGSEVFGLFRGPVQVGAWTPAKGYQALHPGDVWGEPGEAPVALPGIIATGRCKCNRDCPCGFWCDCYRRGKCSPGCNCAPRPEKKLTRPEAAAQDGNPALGEGARVEKDGTLNFGLDREHFAGPRPERYSINGKDAPKEDVLRLLQAQVPDDARKPFLTLIGPAEARKQVLNDLENHPSLAPWKGRLRVQAYNPDDWAVSRAGFVTAGNPTVYLQAADGTVLHRQDDYAGGADALATALRRAHPNYNPSGDPDCRKAPLGALRGVPWSVPVILLGAAGLLILYRPKKEVKL